MGADRRYLERHGNQWRVQVKVPERVRGIIGKARLTQGLGTDSLIKANLLRRPVVAEFHAMIERADRTLQLAAGSNASPVVTEAQEFQVELRKAEADPTYGEVLDEHGGLIADGPTFFRSLILEQTEELSRAGRQREASTFVGLALGNAIPITHYVDTWLAESNMKERQKGSYRTALRNFDRWLMENKKTLTVQGVTKRVAGEYVSTLMAAGRHWKTLNKEVSSCSVYWRWLEKKGHVELNPWQGQSVRKQVVPEEESKRPFTDDEVKALLDGSPEPILKDFMTIAALAGMRINEIADLEVRDVTGGMIKIRVSKTAAGVRTIPISKGLVGLLERRCAGRDGTDTLFPELRTPAEGSSVERYQPISKRFTRYRRQLKVDQRVDGKRQSLVDFHSFRRWFARKTFDALDAGAKGFTHMTVAQVMGHESGDKTLGMTIKYAGSAPMLAKQACVESVRLP